MTFRNRFLRALAAFLLVALQPVAAQQAGAPEATAQKLLTLEALYASPVFESASFRGGRWAEEGPVLTYIEQAEDSAEDSAATDLVRYNLETDERTRLVEGAVLRAPDVERLIQIEDYQYSRDGKKLLLYTDSERVWRLNTKGFYYVYDVERGTLTPVSSREEGFQMFAKLSPSGDRVAFVRDRNLFMVDLETMEETQLTTSGEPGGIINGTSDWVYEEEFGLRDAWAWSPDGQYIAFLQLDETATREFAMADLRGPYPTFERFRYPKAGEVNSEIRAGVIDVRTEETTFFDTGTWMAGGDSLEYIPQLGWTPALDGTHYVYLFRMNRDQNHLDLLYGNPATGEVKTVLEETSETWLEVETGFSDLDVGTITFLDDGAHFVWISERDGHRHLYLYENDGTFVGQITDGDWDVTDFHGVDEETGWVYFTATKESPIERHLYRTKLTAAGSADARMPARTPARPPAPTSEPERITEAAGWHDVNLSSDARYFIDTYSDVTTPPVVTLREAGGEVLQTLEGNEALRDTLAGYRLPAPEFIQVPGADSTMLNAFLIKPAGFDSTRQYPLLMYVYGGPGSQTVRNQWGGTRQLWHQYLADRYGLLVASVDNRGTGARGRDFRTSTYKRLGILEAEDQIAAAEHFGRQPYVDAERIGIWGWSYGGYLTLLSMLYGEGPETFTAGVAVAPVTDWRLYDTIYTERYLSTPQKNPEGYREGAPQTYADRLQDDQDLLIIHGDFDDNVHFQNAIQMADALQEAGKQFEMMVYPGRNHGIYGGNTRLHLFTLITDFLEEELVAGSS